MRPGIKRMSWANRTKRLCQRDYAHHLGILKGILKQMQDYQYRGIHSKLTCPFGDRHEFGKKKYRRNKRRFASS